jgi:hypothetical protein
MAVSAVATIIVIAAVPRTATPALDGTAPDSTAAPEQAVITTVTADRLAAVIGGKYRLRFSSASIAQAAGKDERATVEESSAKLLDGGRFDVVLFGGLPTVRSMACEVVWVDRRGAADLLGDCARVAAGDQGADRVAAWISSQLEAPARPGNPSAIVGATRYALRAIPASHAWVLAMSPRDS